MNWIDEFTALSDEKQKEEIKSKIADAQASLINDRARTDLLNEDNWDSWDSIDAIELEEFGIDVEARKCTVKFRWASYGPKDEDDERNLHGGATAIINEDGNVEYEDTYAEFDDDPPKRKPQQTDRERREEQGNWDVYTNLWEKD